jgi:orotidine-5'-phosphate decarboxylase
MNFIKDLIESIRKKKSVVCMGLDPRLEGDYSIPAHIIEEYGDPNRIILEFNKLLIDATYELIPVIKPQIAFYEMYDALDSLKQTIKYAHQKDLLVILDSKRNDIGSTSKAYAYATFNIYEADACTLNAYLGLDSIQPYFTQFKEKGIFILVKTSNPSSSDFQDLFSIKISDVKGETTEITMKNVKLERNYIHMAKLVEEWTQCLDEYATFTNLGVVVGATFPEEMKVIRKIARRSFILMPGYGVQGAKAEDIKFGFNDGLGGIVNSSRGIIFAWSTRRFY